MATNAKPNKQPAHELIPVLIAWLDEKRSAAAIVEARLAFEVAIEKICQVTGMTVIPDQHLSDFLLQLGALYRKTESTMVRLSLRALITHLEAETRPKPDSRLKPTHYEWGLG